MPDLERLERLKRLRALKEQRGSLATAAPDATAATVEKPSDVSYPHVKGEPFTNVARGIGNIPGDIMDVAGGTLGAVLSPVQTLSAMKSLVEQVPYELGR